MKYTFAILFVLVLSCPAAVHAQRKDKDERKEEREEKSAANKDRVDYTVFRRQILQLPQFSEERKNLAEIKKSTKGMPKIYAVVDSLNESEDGKTLTGFIQVGIADNIISTHELIFDRIMKKIVVIKPTGEKLEIEKEEKEEKEERTNTKKTVKKPPVKKKKSEDDDEEEQEDEEEKPAKGKAKQKDEEED